MIRAVFRGEICDSSRSRVQGVGRCRHWLFADALVTSSVARGKALPIRAEDARAERLVGNAEKDPRGDAEEGARGALRRDMFPPGFLFGTATAAYQVRGSGGSMRGERRERRQRWSSGGRRGKEGWRKGMRPDVLVEGAAREGGRGASIWDVFAHTPGRTHNGDTGDVACDQYHRYEEDVALMRHLGFSAYRFSISWSRILPCASAFLALCTPQHTPCEADEKLSSGRQPVNQEGVEYYNRLIDCLLRNGITPCVTLFHWDLPQALEEEFGGFRGEAIVGAFQDYAHLCFSLLGDRVPYWLTFNEPYTFATKGYAVANFAHNCCPLPSPPFLLPVVRSGSTPHSASPCSETGEYARLCFSLLGDRVPYWLTFNEPYTFALKGYAVGDFAPGRCSDRQCCAEGDGAVEPYVVVHHMLLAHAAAVDCYRREFEPPLSHCPLLPPPIRPSPLLPTPHRPPPQQGGQIGIAVDSEWAEPFSQHPDDVAAADRRMQFNLGWLLHPIFFGAYPPAMRHYVGPRLPSFSPLQAASLKGSVDFVGLNHYTSRYIAHADAREGGEKGRLWSYFDDQHVTVHVERDGRLIGQQAASPWLYEVPWGFQKLLMHITTTYGAPPIYITENGLDEGDDPSLPLHVATSDPHRIRYYHAYLSHLLRAIRQGADVRGYMAWSWMDNFEWQMGNSRRFGLVHVDRTRGLKRTPKASALWWQGLLSGMLVYDS
ncbi:unnamed protein product [Closterium sp. NIES-65]|nr:unnamed protein product [Closterium sp. NIES-65]